jgi:serpin B
MVDGFNRNGGADFAGMFADSAVGSKACILSVLHKATISVTEAGTVATAATAIGVEPVWVRCGPATFVVDHPFVLVIRERFSGAILFIGRVMNPPATSM